MRRRYLMCLCLIGLAGCMEGTKQTPLDREPLSVRLGGEAKIQSIVSDFVEALLDDPRLPERLRGAFQLGDRAALEAKLVERIEKVSAEGKRYAPRDQAEAVRGLGLTEEEYTALREDLDEVLEAHEVDEAERAELREMLAPLLADVLPRT